MIASISKVVNVLQVEDLGDRRAVARDMALVKVANSPANRMLADRFVIEGRARLIDSGDTTVTLELTGGPEQIDAAVRDLEALGIIEMVRSGGIALGRGDETLKR